MRRAVVATTTPAAAVNVRDTRAVFAEVVGEQVLRGRPMSAGPLLKTTDKFAASVAENIIAVPMVTVSAERVDITAIVFHGDLVRFEGQLLFTGRSSVIVQVTGYRRGIHDRAFEQALSAVMTLVAVDENGRPVTLGMPKLVDPDDCAYTERVNRWTSDKKALSAQLTRVQAEIDALAHVPRDMLELPSGGDDEDSVSIGKSQVEFVTGFMPNQLNADGTVFGGELLRWMDGTAVFCAQSFANSENVVTVGTNHIGFYMPVTMMDFVMMSARVTRVSGSRMEIAVDVSLKGVRSMDIKNYFTVALLDADNKEAPVRQQLSVDADDQDGLRAVVKAQRRAELAEEEAALFALKPLEVSTGHRSALHRSKL